jgi:Glycosyl hydrolase 36 superfamily, catalytic domain/Glycosyltransferase family 36
MGATRREFLRGGLGLAVAGKLNRGTIWPSHPAAHADAPAEHDFSFGSGNFGTWTEDEFALPAFRYTLNQTTDPRAVTDVRPGILGPTEHIHQVGNDRIIAIASNYGHVRVRQDEGSPKFLNDFDPETSQFGGGLGYLTDDEETLSTYYDGSNPDFQRIFGVGYYRKKVANKSYVIDQVIHAPFGDDPVLISQVTVTNHRDADATLRWVEYWGCQPYQFSFRAALEGTYGKRTQTELRRDMGRRFSHHVTRVAAGKGLLDTQTFPGRAADEEAAWERTKAALKAYPNGFYTPVENLIPGTRFESLEVPQTFLVSLSGAVSGISSDAASFFGTGGAANPSGLKQPLNENLEGSTAHAGSLIEHTLTLRPKESRTLRFLYGYLPKGFSLDALVVKYEHSTDQLRSSSEEWKRHGMRFEVPAEPWIKREATWNHYYLRSSLTYDDYFEEHILNQNGFYQYTMGFQGAPRDPLQHSMPFLFSDPEIVKSVLRYTLKEVRDDGSVPYAIVGHGVIAPIASDKASDLPLWLIWTASEYVLATRDVDFLNERIPARFSAEPGRTARVSELLERCYRHQVNDVGVGKHGVMRMLVDDWNDGLIYTWASSAMKECMEESESVLNSAMAAWVFDKYARLLDYAGSSSQLAQELRKSAEQHRQATQAQWNGRWFRRAWLGPTLGWLGDTTLWIEPQPWAILSGAATEEQSRSLVQTMNDLLRHGPLGAAQMSDGPDMRSKAGNSLGTLEFGAIWPSLNQTLVWALTGIDPAMAWEEWRRNTLAYHAENYPDIWYGVWSGNDSWNSPLNRLPGGAANEQFFRGTDFPVLNLHAHACSLYSASKLLGMEFTPAGVKLSLNLPAVSYRFDSPLIGVVKTSGHYEGWYMPSRSGTWKLEIAISEDAARAMSLMEVNGIRSPIEKRSNGTIVLSGSSTTNKPLRWALR